MTSGMYVEAPEKFGNGAINWVSDTITAYLVDLDDHGVAITDATNATPIVVTAAGHGFNNGDIVLIAGVGGNTAANGVRKVANVTANTFELTNPADDSDIAGNGAYTSGGHAVDLTTDQWVSDVPSAARVASVNLANKTNVNGVLDADDSTFSSVTGDVCEAVILAKNTGTESTSALIYISAYATGLPVTPNGGDINITWPAGADKIINLNKYV